MNQRSIDCPGSGCSVPFFFLFFSFVTQSHARVHAAQSTQPMAFRFKGVDLRAQYISQFSCRERVLVSNSQKLQKKKKIQKQTFFELVLFA